VRVALISVEALIRAAEAMPDEEYAAMWKRA